MTGGRLIVIGRGATAEGIAELGGRLRYQEIRLTADVPHDLTAEDHVVIAEDEVASGRTLLLAVATLEVMPAYLGYAAPHDEGVKALVTLAAQGAIARRIDCISAPAGVAVGAETPDEIAIAVAAGLIALRNGAQTIGLRADRKEN